MQLDPNYGPDLEGTLAPTLIQLCCSSTALVISYTLVSILSPFASTVS